MGAKVRRKKQDFHGNIFWVTMSDLFIGMFMIFATLFFAFSANTGQGNAEAVKATREVVEVIKEELEKKDINAVTQTESGLKVGKEGGEFEGSVKEKQKNPQKDATEEVLKEHKKADVEIDPFTGMVRISDLELFKINSSELTPKGKEFLKKFIPVYLDTIFSGDLKKHLTYIVIQGHTDSQLFKGVHSPQEQYMLNMNLSMNRAYNVANYIFMLSKNKPYYKELTHVVRVEGASFSSPIIKNGKEDYNKSRRVELRLVLKEQKVDILQQFFSHTNKSAQGEQNYEKL